MRRETPAPDHPRETPAAAHPPRTAERGSPAWPCPAPEHPAPVDRPAGRGGGRRQKHHAPPPDPEPGWPRLGMRWFRGLPRWLARACSGALSGGAVGLAFLGIGLVRALFAMLAGEHVTFHELFPGVLLYVAAFALGGAAAGIMARATRTAAGLLLTAIVAAMLVVFVICWMVMGPPLTWSAGDWLFFEGYSILMGLAGGIGVLSRRKKRKV